MVHLSNVASDFIWENFSEWLIDKKSQAVAQEIASLNRDMNHRPIYRKSKEYVDFLGKSLQKTCDLAKSYSFLDFSSEIEYFAAQLRNQEGLAPE
jgi:hypothetical protein